MSEARHLRALVELVHLLVEGANLRHLAIHVKVLLQLHSRLDRAHRHRMSPVWSSDLTRGCSTPGLVSRHLPCQGGTSDTTFRQYEPSTASGSTPTQGLSAHRSNIRSPGVVLGTCVAPKPAKHSGCLGGLKLVQ